jgi:hypothetical protein
LGKFVLSDKDGRYMKSTRTQTGDRAHVTEMADISREELYSSVDILNYRTRYSLQQL